MTTHQFSSPLARDLFALGAEATKLRFPNSATLAAKAAYDEEMQRQLGEAYFEVPPFAPTAEDLNRMAAADDERYAEGRQHRPHPANPHD